MNKTLLLLICIFCISCENKSDCNLDESLLKYNDSIIAELETDNRFYNFLSAMKEDKLTSFKDEAYRFIIVGPWENTIVHRVTKNSDSITISSKKYWAWDENGDKDSLSETITKKVHLTDWEKLKVSLDSLNFWRFPVIAKKPRMVLDGTSYVIEGYHPKKNICTGRNYHITTRTSPSDSTLYSTIFSDVFDLSSK